MPTARPRYQVTDTGRTRALLDRAADAWPELAGDRKALLLRLAENGAAYLPDDGAAKVDRSLAGYAGQWVALAGGSVLVAAPDAATVAGWLRDHRTRAEHLFRVPEDDGEMVGEHALA